MRDDEIVPGTMCEARPKESMRRGRTPRTCASRASKVVGHGMPHVVCEMHYNAWERACVVGPIDGWTERTEALALAWGWPGRREAAAGRAS